MCCSSHELYFSLPILTHTHTLQPHTIRYIYYMNQSDTEWQQTLANKAIIFIPIPFRTIFNRMMVFGFCFYYVNVLVEWWIKQRFTTTHFSLEISASLWVMLINVLGSLFKWMNVSWWCFTGALFVFFLNCSIFPAPALDSWCTG